MRNNHLRFLFSDEDHLPVSIPEMYNYLASAIVILSLNPLHLETVFHLELTKVRSALTFCISDEKIVDRVGVLRCGPKCSRALFSSQVKSEFPGYALNSPTLMNLDGDGGPLQIIVGTSGGHVHVLNTDGSSRSGFPITTDSIHGQVRIISTEDNF